MTLQQINSKLHEVGSVRAFWASKTFKGVSDWDESFYFGQTGNLTLDDDYQEPCFVPDCGPYSGGAVSISETKEIHAPSIGHYSW